MAHHTRNPIKWHGDTPLGHFTIIPNELARDTELSLYAYRAAIVIRTHAEDYEVSAASLAKTFGWHRDTAGKALRELADARWLAIRTYRTAEGKRLFDEYHVHASRKFTETEAATLRESVILPTSRAYDVGTPLPSGQAPPCPTDWHHPAYGVGTKEEQLEDELEEQLEHQGPELDPDCVYCDTSPVNVCGLHFHDYPHRYIEPVTAHPGPESVTNQTSASVRPRPAIDSGKCWGCRTVGRDGCPVHAPSCQPASA